MKYLALLIPLALVACRSGSTNAARGEASVERSPDGAPLAPFPFTADAIRARCVEGLALTFRIERRGAPVELQSMRFHDWSQDAVNVEMTRRREDGTLLAPANDSRATWKELRRHASFPAEVTARARDVLTTRAGEWECWQYVIATVDGGTMRYWFADQLPGPPIRVDQERDGERVMRMDLVRIDFPADN